MGERDGWVGGGGSARGVRSRRAERRAEHAAPPDGPPLLPLKPHPLQRTQEYGCKQEVAPIVVI